MADSKSLLSDRYGLSDSAASANAGAVYTVSACPPRPLFSLIKFLILPEPLEPEYQSRKLTAAAAALCGAQVSMIVSPFLGRAVDYLGRRQLLAMFGTFLTVGLALRCLSSVAGNPSARPIHAVSSLCFKIITREEKKGKIGYFLVLVLPRCQPSTRSRAAATTRPSTHSLPCSYSA